MDPLKIRPRENWVLVLADERREVLASGIILPVETGAEKVTESAGTLLRIGNGDRIGALGLCAGQRIVYRGFIKYAHRLDTQETWPSGAKKDYFLMSVDDILGVTSDGVEVGVYSGRPQVPHKG